MTPRVHLSLRVSELGRSVAFYQELLGCAPDKRHDDYARFMPTGTPILLSLVPGAGQADAGRVDHLGLRLPDRATLAEARQRLSGITERTEEASTCCYAVQDKLWLTDPDGHSWEVYVVTDDDAAAMKPVGSGCCDTAAAAPAESSCCG